MQLVLEGWYIDVGHLTHKAIVDMALSRGKNALPLIFLSLITALCISVWSTDALVEKKINILPSQVLGLKGLVQKVTTVLGATPEHFATTFVALLDPYFQNVQ
ncbi:hypothetical protein V6N12_043090 [Hibiscus sabdariffa]|uniref:Uncharacterized protein n=1 Tax=Hibiscus sabdariffa TaxID=183260 RepID=A0ABR2DI76_9ROSI